MKLRRARADDVPALTDLSREAFIATFGHLYRPEDLTAFLDEYRTRDKFHECLAEPASILQVAEVDGTLAAYGLIVRGHRFEKEPEPRAARPVLLSQLYCAPAMTGRGLGTALLDWAIAEARAWHADALQLSVYSENVDAQRFYRRFGFAWKADIDFWVGNHRDPEFLFELPLT